MAFFSAINSFNSGELSPKMLGRPDVSQYAHGCRTMLNFLCTPHGEAERRPGTVFLDLPGGSACRLIPFVFSDEAAFLCYFTDGKIRFYQAGKFAAEIVSPFTEAELPKLNFVQSADVMFLVSGSRPIHELKRTGEATFEIAEMEFTYPAVLDPNLTDTTIQPSARSGEIILFASADLFLPEHVGSYWDIVHTRTENELQHDFKGDGESESIEVFGYWNFTTHGTWIGTVKLQRSFDNGTSWSDYRSWSSNRDNNVSTSGEEDKPDVLYRIVMTDYEKSNTGTIKYCEAVLSNPDFQTTGVVRITGVKSPTEANATVIKKLGGVTPTKEWNEGAWSQKRGFPRAISFYEERLIVAGSDHQPQTIWGSRVNDWNNFLMNDLDDSGISFTLCSDTVNHIRWLCQHDSLVIGTTDSEWTMSASSKDEALTASNVRIKRQSVYGSSPVSAKMAGEVVLFVQRQGRKVREFVYSWEKDGYSSPDLTILADHVTESGISETALQRQPDTILWCLLGNGTLAALTYERDQEVVGWQRIETDGKVLSIAVLPEAGEDIVYLAVLREKKIFLEHFAPRSYSRIEEAVFVDCAVTVHGDQLTEVSGLDHLEGREVQVLLDGAEHPNRVVKEGKIKLETPGDYIVVGLPFLSLLSPMPIESENENGTTLLRRKTVAEIRIRVRNSVGGEVREGSGNWRTIVSRSADADQVSHRIEPKSEGVQLNPAGGYARETSIEIRQSAPLPLNICSLTALCEVVE